MEYFKGFSGILIRNISSKIKSDTPKSGGPLPIELGGHAPPPNF